MLTMLLLMLLLSVKPVIYAKGDYPQTFRIPEFWDEEKQYCFFYQETNVSCVPASVQMILKSYGVSPLPTQKELATEMKTDLNHTTDWKYTYIPFNKRDYTKYINQSLSSNVDWALLYLKRNISRNFPTIVITWYDQTARKIGIMTHGRVVTGYNETGIFFHDPIDGPNRYLHNRDFTDLWNTSYGYWALIIESETSPLEEANLLQLFIENLDIIALLIVGLVSEKHFVSRLATFSNSIALDLFFIRKGFTPWYVVIYLLIGSFLGIIGLIAYVENESLSERYYIICFLYSSIIAGLIMLVGIFLL
jgi:hypothetical protein